MSYIGPQFHEGELTFRVWAPEKESMQLHIVSPQPQVFEMEKTEDGYFIFQMTNPAPDLRYFYAPENGERYPDPGSNFQPEGVHGPSQVVNHALFSWDDGDWR